MTLLGLQQKKVKYHIEIILSPDKMLKGATDNDLEDHKWAKNQWEEYTADSKAKHHLLSVLPANEINQIETYKSANDLWDKLMKLHESISYAKLVKRYFWGVRSTIWN